MKVQSFKFLVAALTVISLAACGSIHPRHSGSVRLETILEPVKDSLVVTDKKPLVFPTTVAVLMVPARGSSELADTTLRRASEELKKELLKNDKYINGVSIISPDDIRDKVTLETLRNLYGADVLILLTHRQDRRHVQGSFAQLMNIAIAPAFIVPSVRVTTTTAVDAKIIHIPSNAIIFRSSGFDERSTLMTPISAEGAKGGEQNLVGFIAAVTDLGRNVSKKLAQLDSFDMSKAVSVNQLLEEGSAVAAGAGTPAGSTGSTGGPAKAPAEAGWQQVDSYKRSGGGAAGLPLLATLLLLWGGRLRQRGIRHARRG